MGCGSVGRWGHLHLPEVSGAAATPMTSSHDALYRAICAQPDEDTPRLMFADLIEENGDPLRAQFIRTQVAARARSRLTTRRGCSSAAARTGRRDRPCDGAHPPEDAARRVRLAPVRVPPRVPVEGRGAVARDALVQSGDELFEFAAPIQALDIDARDRPDLGALAEWPHLASFAQTRNLRRLVRHARHRPAGRIGIRDESHRSRLRVRRHFARRAPHAGRVAAVRPTHRPRTAVDPVRPRHCWSIRSGRRANPGRFVAVVALAFNRIGRDDAEHLFALPVMRELEHLDLSDNKRLGVEGVTALAESGLIRGLRILNLSNTRPGMPGVKSLVEASGLAGLRMLDLSDNLLGPVAMKALAGCGGLRGLRVLNLSSNLVGDAGAAALAASRSFAGLLELDLRDADVSDAGALALAESPHLDGLLRLDLRRCDSRPLGKAARAASARGAVRGSRVPSKDANHLLMRKPARHVWASGRGWRRAKHRPPLSPKRGEGKSDHDRSRRTLPCHSRQPAGRHAAAGVRGRARRERRPAPCGVRPRAGGAEPRPRVRPALGASAAARAEDLAANPQWTAELELPDRIEWARDPFRRGLPGARFRPTTGPRSWPTPTNSS